MKLFEFIDKLDKPYDIFYTDSVNSPLHWHHYCEILYIKSGRLKLICNNICHVLESGDLCYIYPMSLHEVLPADTNEECDYAVIKFDIHTINIPQAYLESIYDYFDKRETGTDDCIIATKSVLDPDFNKLIDNTVKEYISGNDFSILQIQANIYSILISLARLNPKAKQTKNTKPNQISLDNILEYIDTHSAEALEVKDLASKCNMSYSYFAKQFRDNYGRSCKDYITYIRLNKAEELLLHSNYDIAYIANETGFFDSSHFIRSYKKWKNTTPRSQRYKQR